MAHIGFVSTSVLESKDGVSRIRRKCRDDGVWKIAGKGKFDYDEITKKMDQQTRSQEEGHRLKD